MNRVNDERFPNTVCGVVLQAQMKKSWKTGLPVPIRNKCQFSWYCDGKSDEIKDEESYKKILDFSRLMMHNDIRFVDITDGATHYHADYVKPSWAKTKVRTTEIGDHIFYRWEKK
jgi:spore germination cell wall hydrolase CwlJ-like protein